MRHERRGAARHMGPPVTNVEVAHHAERSERRPSSNKNIDGSAVDVARCVGTAFSPRACHHRMSPRDFFCAVLISLLLARKKDPRARQARTPASCISWQTEWVPASLAGADRNSFPRDTSLLTRPTICRKIDAHPVKKSTRNALNLIHDMKTTNFSFPLSTWTLRTS